MKIKSLSWFISASMFHPTTYLFIIFSLYLRNKTWTTKVIGYLSTTTFSIGLPVNIGTADGENTIFILRTL